jgi:hypothetical protein
MVAASAAISILPAPASLAPADGSGPALPGTPDGLFTRFEVALPPPAVTVSAASIAAARDATSASLRARSLLLPTAK